MFKKILSNKAYPVVFLAIIVIVSVVLLIGVNSLTSDIVESRRVEEITGILENIFPEMSDYELDDEVYIIYEDGEKAGYAFMASGSGYGGNIDILVGLDSSFGIKGVSILSQTETPGVGNRITESSFTDQFKGLSASDIALKSEGGKIDAITGATISSRAVVNAVKEKMVEILDTLEK
ncbi:MAG: RnfABCDGE type electron transport complex subunit G [Actinobacteria bacterium]|nr:RnfABCDGE type electron transport complex subunit G [Actinomycetota bacterium]